MDVERFINAPEQYQVWEMTHSNASYSMKDYAYKISTSQEFHNWLSSHPNGTLEQYLAILQQQQQAYYNSPQYQISSLRSIVETQEKTIQDLNYQIEELNSEISNNAAEIKSLQTTSIVFGSISLVLTILIAYLAYRLRKNSKVSSFRKSRNEYTKQNSENKIRWLVNTIIEGVIFFLPIFVFLSIIRNTEEHRAPVVSYQHPEWLEQMWFSETNAGLIASFLFFFIITFLLYHYIRYKKIDATALISLVIISILLALMTNYICGEIQLYGSHGDKINYSILPYKFYIYSFLIIEACWIILSYKRNSITNLFHSFKSS